MPGRVARVRPRVELERRAGGGLQRTRGRHRRTEQRERDKISVRDLRLRSVWVPAGVCLGDPAALRSEKMSRERLLFCNYLVRERERSFCCVLVLCCAFSDLDGVRAQVDLGRLQKEKKPFYFSFSYARPEPVLAIFEYNSGFLLQNGAKKDDLSVLVMSSTARYLYQRR